MSPLFHNSRVIMLIGGFVLVALALLIFAANDSGSGAPASSVSPYLSVAPAAPASAALGEDLLTALALLKTISLDTSLFSDPAFESLSDWGKEISPQPAGRRNPFAPLGVTASVAKPAAAPPAPPPSTTPALAPQTAGMGAAMPPASAPQDDSRASVWDFSDIDFSF